VSNLTIGLDSGLTVTKAVLFDERGRPRASASRRLPQSSPHPRWVERDVDGMWDASAAALRELLATAGVQGSEIAGIGVTAHGDGLYLIDAQGRPTRPGIVSLDSRAHQIVERWDAEGRTKRNLELAGQPFFPAAPEPILAWLLENEPEVVERTRWLLPCKDVIKQRLTGEVSTDPTEASAGWCDVHTQEYSDDVLALLGFSAHKDKLPPVVPCTEAAGRITAGAAEATGLAEGTPVVAGLHDVDASAIGTGAYRSGQLTMIAGTYSINEVIADQPVPGDEWFARSFIDRGQWMHMAISPASATNLEWFVQKLCAADVREAEAARTDPFAFIEAEVAAASRDAGGVVFLPFLYGSPHGSAPSGTFLGLRGWHDRGHLLRAVMEGVVFNHRTHVDALLTSFPVTEARLTGGATNSRRWAQMFADATGLEVVLTDSKEAGALGTAMCAMVGAGLYDSVESAIQATVHDTDRLMPDDGEERERLDTGYEHYRRVIDALEGAWDPRGAA
jgi:L-xylulokinase